MKGVARGMSQFYENDRVGGKHESSAVIIALVASVRDAQSIMLRKRFSTGVDKVRATLEQIEIIVEDGFSVVRVSTFLAIIGCHSSPSCWRTIG